MVILNLSSKSTIPPLGGIVPNIFFYYLCTQVYLSAEVLPFFNPLETNTKSTSTAKIEIQGFIANDPVSLDDFFHDWKGAYHPKNGNNAALEFARIDAGSEIDDGYYLGYFYQRDTLIKSNKGFVDGYYAVKNKLHFPTDKFYELALGIEGIDRQGVVLSKSFLLYDSGDHCIEAGIAGYLSYDVDVQHGSLSGTGVLHTDNSYSAYAKADYHFIDNLLYDGWDSDAERNTDRTFGIGYGMHLALTYVNRVYRFKIHMVANDLLAHSHWKNLPYSHDITINTKNQTIGDNGYVEYNPTVSGWEIYKDFTQTVETKYHMDISKIFLETYGVEIGFDGVDYLHMPYMAFSKYFQTKKVEFLYEYRFGSVGIKYQDENFYLSILANGFSHASTVGISGGYTYHF